VRREKELCKYQKQEGGREGGEGRRMRRWSSCEQGRERRKQIDDAMKRKNNNCVCTGQNAEQEGGREGGREGGLFSWCFLFPSFRPF